MNCEKMDFYRFILAIHKCWARENTICWAFLDGSRVNTLRCHQTWLAGNPPRNGG